MSTCGWLLQIHICGLFFSVEFGIEAEGGEEVLEGGVDFDGAPGGWVAVADADGAEGEGEATAVGDGAGVGS